MAFHPSSLSIAAGGTVVFINQDAAPHTATSDDGLFDTGLLSQGQSAQLTFSAAGTYPYYCALHPAMRGVIIVA
jgi:plastocyanin